MRFTALFAFCLLLHFTAFAQTAIIRGKAVGDKPPKGKVVLYQYTDYLTQNMYDRSAKMIESDTFQFMLRHHKYTEPFMLTHGKHSTKVFIEPGGEYEVWLGEQGFVLVKEPTGNLNKKIMEYGNSMFNFLNAAKGADAISPKAFDDFKMQQYMKYYNEKNDFFNAYYKYDMKIKELFFGATGQYPMNKGAFDKAERNYLTNTKIRLNHPKWGEYFRTHVEYRNRFCKLQRIDCCDPLADCKKTSFFQEARLFENDTLEDLAMIEAISYKIEANKGSDLEYLRKMHLMLDSMAQSGATAPGRFIARQYKEQYDLFGIGSPMPDITLQSIDSENLINVKDFKGKYVLIDFWALWCKPCLKEMQFLSALTDRQSDKLQLISISVDESKERANSFVKDKGYSWLFLYNGEDRDLLNKLLINVYPSYFLFDPNGELVYRPSSLEAEWDKILEIISSDKTEPALEDN